MRIYLFIIIFLLSAASSAAQPEPAVITPTDPVRTVEQQNARRTALQQESASIASNQRELENQLNDLPRQLESLQPKQITQTLVEQAAVDLQAARLRLEGALTEQQNAERRITDLGKGIAELEAREQLLKNPVVDPLTSKEDRAEQLQRTQQRLAQQQVDLELESLSLTNLRNQIELAKMRVKIASQWHEQIERSYRRIQEQTRLDTQVELVSRLQTDQVSLQDRANAIKQRLAQERGTMSLALGNVWRPNYARWMSGLTCSIWIGNWRKTPARWPACVMPYKTAVLPLNNCTKVYIYPQLYRAN